MTANRSEAALALHRFGFGPAHDSIAAIADDPRGAVLAELNHPYAGRVVVDFPSSAAAARAVFDFQAAQRAKQKLLSRLQKAAEANSTEARMAELGLAALTADTQMGQISGQNRLPLPAQLLQNEAKVHFDAATDAQMGFVERLVWFWSNHFCISADKIPSMAGSYEREAIRPHVLGRFADMLQAVESHPAMLFYLDNVQSMGPNSITGIDQDKGLNENLARETLELHTVGVRSGYTQGDVTNLAKVLTGWTWLPPSEPMHGGEFVFNPLLHEPGDQIVLNKRYPNTGIQQGRAVLADIAHNPATARHIAQQLASYFVADEPPASLVAKIEKTFNEKAGDLKEVAQTLATAEESWTPQRTKLKPPAEWLVGVLRVTGGGSIIPIGLLMAAQTQLGEPLWRPPAPNGHPDTEAAWIDGVVQRVDIANQFANRLADRVDPRELVDIALGPLASADTRATIARAESRAQALTLLVMSPEFLRS